MRPLSLYTRRSAFQAKALREVDHGHRPGDGCDRFATLPRKRGHARRHDDLVDDNSANLQIGKHGLDVFRRAEDPMGTDGASDIPVLLPQHPSDLDPIGRDFRNRLKIGFC